MIIRHLSIDCAYINKVLEPITQREHGVTEFEIEAKNHGADIDLSECTLATYYGLKPDEHKVGVECRVDKDKGLIYLPLYLQMTTAEGVLKGIVELQFPEGNVRFSDINFKVSFAPDDTKIESTDDFNILENFISKPTTDGVVGQVLSIDNDGNTIWRTLKEFDGDYAHLDNKPSINGVGLNGDKSLEDLNIKQAYTADDIPFADGETFQQKFNNGELKGQDGTDGKTPVKGTDYFTAEDKTEFTAEVTESLKPELAKKQDKLTAGSVTTVNIANKAVTMEKLSEDVANQFSELKDDLVKIQNLITESNKIPVSFIWGSMSTNPNSEYVAYNKKSRAYSDVTFTSTIAIQFQGISVSVRYFNNEFDLEKSTDWITQSPLIIETNNYYGFRLLVKNDDDTDINLENLSEQLSVYTGKNSVTNFFRGVYEPVVGNSISNIMNKPNRCSLTKIFKITDTMMVVVPKGYSISYRVVDANQDIKKSSDWIGNNFTIHNGEYVFAFKRSDEAKMSYIDVINLSEFKITKHIDVEYTFANTGTYENKSLTTYKNSGFISCAIGDTFEYCIRIKGGYAVHLFDKDKNLISRDIHIATTNKSNDFTFSGTYRISKPSVKYIWFDTMNDTHNDYQYYKPSIKMLTDSKSSPNLTIRCAKEKTYNDGTPPKIEWYLLEDVNTEIFYKSKDFSNIERLFCWDNDFSSLDYSFGITKDNDIIAVFKTESLDDLSTHDDNRRKNPFVFDAKNNYACIEVDISDKIKPSGWLSNTGYRVLPDGTILFCEYTRPSVATTNVWRIDSNSDIKNPSNWIVVKSFNLSGNLYSGLKHCHMIMYDHYTGITYLSTGDDDIGSQVWHSKDGGITWTQTRDASEKYCRMLNYVFLEDYIYWSSDTAVKNYHYIFRAPRKEDGVIDYDNVTDLQLIPYIDTHVATYGVSYLKDLNLLQLIERVDGTGNATEMPIRGYDLATNSLVTLGVIKSVDGVGHNLGFRTEYTEWYPNDGIIKFGFGGKYTWNSAINCNKGFGNVWSYTEKCCVNNLTMKPFKSDNKFGVKFDTIIIN